MRAGKLRHRITIREVIETKSATGAPIQTWRDWADVWASVEPLRGREYFASKQIQAEVSTRIRIRYLEGVTPKMQVLFNTKTYLIDSVINPEERNREMQLMCRELI